MVSNGNGERGGVGALLATLRMVLGNPAVRGFLRQATRNEVCVYGDGEEVKGPILYHALASFAGEAVNCPLGARFLSGLIKSLLKLGIKVLKGREEEARDALKDPAVRRGITLVLKGIALYGITVPQKMPAPFLIVWNFTNLCNFRCKHCYQTAGRPLPDELSLEEKLEVVAQLDRAGVAAVALSGGEPTIHPHFLPVIREISRRGMYPAVATNGWVFADKEKLLEAKRAGLRYVEVSVDSANPRKHDEFRGVEGAWERAIKALQNAAELGISHALAMTVTRFNYEEAPEVIDLADELGLQRIVFFNFIPVGRGKEIVKYDLTPEQREEFLRMIYKEMGKHKGLQIVSTAPQYARVTLQLSGGEEVSPAHFYVGNDPIVKSLAEFIGGCGAGRIYAAIQPEGTVTPCVFMPIPVGNVRQKEFREIWETSEVMLKLRERAKHVWGYCANCPYLNVCGGCRARAYAYFRDPLGPDPGCVLNKKYWEQIREELEILTPEEGEKQVAISR